MPHGPAPKPTALRVLRGDRPNRINREEPQPPDHQLVRPVWLSAFAREEWDRIAADLMAMGVAKRIDSSGLAAYCEAVSRFRIATEVVAKSGPLIIDRDGDVRRNPAVAQARDASNEMRIWAREFGLTPSARQPLRVHHTGDPTSLAGILGA